MANKTLLEATNAILKRVKLIAGDSGELATLTDSARQTAIDAAVQAVNEGIDELYTSTGIALPDQQAEATITLATGTRTATLATGLVRIRWPFIDKTNTQRLFEYPGGYNAMLQGDPEQNDTGLPMYAAIRPTDGLLYLDRSPTSVENGRVYTYQYDKDTELDEAADQVPFNDIVFRAMVPVWAELWKREARGEFDEGSYRLSVGRAARLLTKTPARTHYNPRA